MNHMDTIENYIEITRQQIIRQLQEEISHFQRELGKMPSDSENEGDRWGHRVYNKMISRKRQLIATLS